MNRRSLLRLGGIALGGAGVAPRVLAAAADAVDGEEVAGVQALRLRPGDTLLVTIPGELSPSQFETARDNIWEALGGVGLGDVPALVITGGVTIKVVRRGDEAS